MSGGRPTKYREEYCQKATDFMAQGFSITACAAHLGTCKATIYKWIDDYPKFSDAISQGRALSQCFFENLMIKKAGAAPGSKNYDMSATIFALKTRFHKDFGEKQKIEQTIDQRVMSVEDFITKGEENE